MTEPTGAAGSSGALQETLEAILDHVRRLLAPSGCAFLIVDRHRRRIHPEAAWFASDAVRSAMHPVLSRAYDPLRPGLTEAAIENGAPLLVRDFAAWAGAEPLRARLEERLDRAAAEVAWEWYRSSCFIACPVGVAESIRGVLAISVPGERPIDVDDLRAVEVLAGLAGLVLDRTELLEREAARAREELLLNEAARDVSASLDAEEVNQAVVRQAQRLTGAQMVLLTRHDAATAELRAVASVGFSRRVSEGRFRVAEGMIGRVAATGRPYLSRPDDGERFLRWVIDAEGITGFAHVPVSLGPRLFGVLTVSDRRPGAIGEQALRRLEALAGLAAAAIANALEFQHERRISRALARGFLPETHDGLPHVTSGVVYEPAERGGGGDFFGLWKLPGGGTAMLVGDVSGKGIEVSAASAMARFFVEARAWDCGSPAEVFRQVNALICGRMRAVEFVPTFLGVLEEGLLRYCNAGHLPPLLAPATGGVEELVAGGIPLGVDDGARWADSERPLASGDVIFAATDGLVEARRGGEQFGEARVRELVAEHARKLSMQELVEMAYRDVVRWATKADDDIVVLAVRAR